MMEALRRGAASWVAKILLGLLIVSFAVWGVADVFTGYGQRSLARVGKTEISADEFQNALQTELNRLSSQIGRRLTNEQARAFGIDTRVLSRIIGSAALDTQARELGLAVPDSEIAEAIRTDPNYKGLTGAFDRARFNEMLRQNGMSEPRYFATRKAAEVREQLTDALLDGVNVPKPLVDIAYKFREELRTIAYVTLDAEKAGKVPEPDEAKLREYYEQNKRAFLAPEYRKLSLLLLTTDEVKKLVPVSDDEVRAEYERDKERFNDPEKRRILQLSFPDIEAAEKAAIAIGKAKSFEEGAKALGIQESDFDLGLVARSDLIDKALAEAAFSLEKGKTSKPVAGRFTTAVLHVTEIEPGKQRTFDDVKERIREQLALERSGREVQSLHDKVDDARGIGKSLKEIAESLKLRYIEVAAVDRSGSGPDGKPAFEHPDAQTIARSAFEAGAGVDRDSIELQDGYVWIDMLGSTPERQKPFEEVQSDVKAQYLEAERRKAINAAANALVDRIDKGEPLDAVAKEHGLKVETSKPFKRNAPTTALTQSGVRQAFALPKGKAASVETPDGKSRSVIVVTDITPAPPATKEQTDQLTNEMARLMQNDALSSYVGALQERYGVAINDTVLKRTLGIDRQ
jgi:peptidyl-prolyl cis-trans isomerase D